MSAQVEKIALFIDGANLYATAKSLGFDIDYKRLLREFQSRGYLLRAFYYTAVIEDQEYSSIRPLIDWLDYNGYTVVTKATKEFVDQTGRRKVKGNMDIELAVDAMELAPHIDHMVLFSGDGDFRSLVEAVQRRGVRVTVDLDHLDAAADGGRRVAPAGRHLHRHRGAAASRSAATRPSARRATRPREPRGERQHTPQFLQRGPRRAARRCRRRRRIRGLIGRLLSAQFRSWPANRQAGPRLSALPAARRLPRELARARAVWFNAPVPSFGPLDARLLIVGLAPGLRGANRTGRPFTGDYAGDLLYATLKEYGFARGNFEARADDRLELVDARITNARALRAAGEQADAGRDQHLPRISRPRPSPRCASCAPSWRSAASPTRRP